MAIARLSGLAAKLAHRITARRREGDDDVALISGSSWFDRAYYLATYPDVAASGIDPVQHYVRFGAAERRNPGPRFDTAFYLDSNQDVAEAGINPLVHFVSHGEREGRLAIAPRSVEEVATAGARLSSEGMANEVILASGCFDTAHYLAQLAAFGDPLDAADTVAHYVAKGASLGLNPVAWFDTAFYLRRYRDVEAAGVNPFHHFLAHGWRELRSPRPGIDVAWLLLFVPELREGRLEIPQYLRDSDGAGLRPVPAGGYAHNDKVRLVSAISRFLECPDLDPRTAYAVGRLAAKIGAHSLACRCHGRAHEVAPSVTRYMAALAEAHRRLGEHVAHARVLERLVSATGGSATELYSLGLARREAGDLQGAADALESSLERRKSSDTAYQLGLVRTELGMVGFAEEAFAIARRLSDVRDAGWAGLGVLHEAYGDHAKAAEAYESQLTVTTAELRPALYYRLGRARERLFNWEAAEQAYVKAAQLASSVGRPEWHFRIGFVNERMGRLEEASIAYQAAIALAQDARPDWEYRLGTVLRCLGKNGAAASAYLRSLPAAVVAAMHSGGLFIGDEGYQADSALNRYLQQFCSDGIALPMVAASQPREDWMAEGRRRLDAGELVAAAEAFLLAAERDDLQSPVPYALAGEAFLRSENDAEAAETLANVRPFRRPHLVGLGAIERDPALLLSTIYLEYVETLPLAPRTILYESFSGLSITCSPLAIFRHVVDHPDFSAYTHVWVINDRSRVPADVATRSNVVFISRGSYAYARHLATAAYLVNNSGFPGYFILREGQRNLATWHGTPLKTLGKEQKYKFYDHKRTQRNLLHATHIITPNPHTTRVELDGYEIRTLYRGRFAETGYPRVDLTLNADESTRGALYRQLSVDPKTKVVLYAPTWRGTPDEVWFDFEKLQDDLNTLASLNCQVLFRGHSWLERAINAADVHCNVVPADIDTNELLSIVDVLVTDYSSVFFDFFATGRPVVYYIYDLEDYARDRGLYFDMKRLPGAKCRTAEELRVAVEQALQLPVGLSDSSSEFNLHDDGSATQRVVDFFFNDDPGKCAVSLEVPAKKRILMHAGAFADDERTRVAIEFSNALDMDRYELVVAFTPSAIELMAGGTERFGALPRSVIGLPRYGHALMSPEERWLRRRYEIGQLPDSEEASSTVRRAYQRELYRMTGGAKFDVVVAFDGAGPFWTRLLLDGRSCGAAICISETGLSCSISVGTHELTYRELRDAGVSLLVDLVESIAGP